MASFEEHIEKAKSNFAFLESINKNSGTYVDWQVTVVYYVGVHLINAHLAKFDLHYLQHSEIVNAISSSNPLNVAILPQDVCLKFRKLTNLSRQSRYLCHESVQRRGDGNSYNTSNKNLAEAIRILDHLVDFFVKKYGIAFPQIEFFNREVGVTHSLIYFKNRGVGGAES